MTSQPEVIIRNRFPNIINFIHFINLNLMDFIIYLKNFTCIQEIILIFCVYKFKMGLVATMPSPNLLTYSAYS